MAYYHVDLTRRAPGRKNLMIPVRSFGFEASSDTQAVMLAKGMQVFPSVDDCDRVRLFTKDREKCLWSEAAYA